MKIDIVGVPHFQIAMTKKIVTFLRNIGSRHYDQTCRASALEGGFLFGWSNMVAAPDPASYVFATVRDLDIALKICETASMAERMMLDDFIDSARLAVETANKILASCKWKQEVSKSGVWLSNTRERIINIPVDAGSCRESDNPPADRMSLRDYFAGQVIAGQISRCSMKDLEELPATAYKVADEMLRVRTRDA